MHTVNKDTTKTHMLRHKVTASGTLKGIGHIEGARALVDVQVVKGYVNRHDPSEKVHNHDVKVVGRKRKPILNGNVIDEARNTIQRIISPYLSTYPDITSDCLKSCNIHRAECGQISLNVVTAL